MRLKRLDLFGFKSFADRTVMDFEHTLTGIVGPNGCGKSNVVDAVRWVLGERRPTSMRGTEMTDVIFKGSVSRPALGLAEVTLVVDNDAGVLEGRGAEVSITRRVYKSGEGEYLIDGERVRLKDLREMLFDTGLGSRGYSVLEQGKIDAVLSADALERRSIFEEAAGISRYRQRKKEAESRLKRVGQDMQRLDDVIGELATRTRSLKIQAGRAERYVTARDAWREEGTRLYRHQVHGCDRTLERLRGELGAGEARAAELRAERAALEGGLEGRGREQAELSEAVDRLASEAASVAGDLRALDERRSQLASRVGAWRDSSEEEARRAEELERKLSERRAELAELEAQLAALADTAERAEARVGEEDRDAREGAARYRAARAASEEQNEVVLGCLHERTAAQNAVSHLQQSLGPHAERARRAEERREEARRNLEAGRRAEVSARENLAQAEERMEAAEAHREVLEGRVGGLEARLRELETARVELELERTRLQSRVESLLDWEREREGLEAGARSLLNGSHPDAEHAPEGAEARDDAAEAERPGGLLGLLADRLRTRAHWARALDAVLGERAQALVVEDPGAAARAVAWLKTFEKGQVRIVTPRGFGAAAARPAGEAERLAADGRVAGPLREHVEVDPGCEELADLLLAGVYLVRDLASGMALVAEHSGLRCVTPDGDLVDAGSLHGGWREVAHGPVGRRATAAELDERDAELEARLASIASEAGELGERRDGLARELGELRAEIEVRRDVLAEARGAGDTARARLADLEEARVLCEREWETLAADHTRLEGELQEARRLLEVTTARFELENGRLQELEDARRELEARREELSRRSGQAQVEWTRVREQLEGLQRRNADLARALAEGEEDLERARRLSEQHRVSASAGEAESEELAAERVRLQERREVLEAELGTLRGRERAGRGELEDLRRRSEGIVRELEELQERVSRQRLEEQRVELTRTEVLRRVEEDLALVAHELLEDFEPEPELEGDPGALDQLAERVAELRGQLDKLGPVNLEAVQELEEVSGRLAFLEEQRSDLVRSRQSLEGTLRRINDESERLFLETFEGIRGHFQAIFRRLFGGGRADVSLEDGAPVLEAGIEIVARPPGREMLPIGLLSGGQRTLTALALLFAIFETRPSPFCVLDEVDAALDDANIGRFLTLLESFRDGTQFIVVTHNKGTMSACDSLYGVTMEVRGVSRHVSVELSDVDEFVPEATGDARAASERPAPPEPLPEEEEPPGEEAVVELVPAGSAAAVAEEVGDAPEARRQEEPPPVDQDERGEGEGGEGEDLDSRPVRSAS